MGGISGRLTYANVMATLAVFIALGGTALAAVIITDNSQVASDTISGHLPPAGKHSNIIGGSINATDLANRSVTPAKLSAAQAWHSVGPGSPTQNLCADPANTAVFCTVVDGTPYPWVNYGGSFANAGFYANQLGIVHLKGVVRVGSRLEGANLNESPIFRLPASYAPTHVRVFPTVGGNDSGQEVAQGRVDVKPNGLVVLEQDCQPGPTFCSADGVFVTLDAISFRRDG
jgi:hypothetical protein